PTCSEVEDAAATNRRELVAVAEKRDRRVRSVGDGEQRAGGILVEHAGLIDEEDVAGQQAGAYVGCGAGSRVDSRPVAVLVPPVAVLMDEPGSGECVDP